LVTRAMARWRCRLAQAAAAVVKFSYRTDTHRRPGRSFITCWPAWRTSLAHGLTAGHRLKKGRSPPNYCSTRMLRDRDTSLWHASTVLFDRTSNREFRSGILQVGSWRRAEERSDQAAAPRRVRGGGKPAGQLSQTAAWPCRHAIAGRQNKRARNGRNMPAP
jgi:hypothetical protein